MPENGNPNVPRISQFIESIIFNSRWLALPFLLGLIVGLAAMLVKFCIKLGEFVIEMPRAPAHDMLTGILGLIDLTLTANLIVIVICSSYENFIARIDPAKHPTWPEGLLRIGFSGLKQKVVGSIVVIAAVNTLEWFTDIENRADTSKLTWVVVIVLTFALTLLMLAAADRLNANGLTPNGQNPNGQGDGH